ncbi:hypothetical protein GCM10011351_12740 [Paraliobacillus quinghaiensis]|uniref:Uncharacterized protein n=1 Tax=Paraliobacillus quinghaiensis TaxID=470815 RepID=A0A917WU77_9BACI|nr:hypothetical protein [Paraliobacillus quinghaiensis]GGM28273.1 hypothetical protein GCM10011351_12740 [Paraliobacillus quinghaiensis]
MFDTVKLAVPLILNEQEIKDIDWTQTNSSQRSSNNTSRTIFKTLNDDDYKGCPFIRYTYKEDDPSRCWLKVEVSIPTFLNGTNVYELQDGDIEIFFKVIRKYLSVKLKINLTRVPPIEQCTVEKVHVCKNFDVGDKKPHYLRAMASCIIPKYQKRYYCSVGSDKVESVEWKASKRKEKIYDKEGEIQQQKQYCNKARHLKKSKGLLRYEIELSDNEIRQISTNRRAGVVLDNAIAKRIIQNGLDRNGLSSGIKYTSLQQVIDAINKQPLELRTKSSLIAFVTELLFNGENECRNKYASSTYRKRKRQLKNILGVDELLIGDKTLPPLNVLTRQKRTASVVAKQ